MKKKIFFISVLLLISISFLPNSFAKDYTQMGLPESAIARLGKGYINDIAYSPDGRRLAVATSIGVWVYNTATDTELNLFSEEPDYVQTIAFSPDSRTLASGGYLPNNVIRLWDTGTGELRDTLEGDEEILALTFSPDGTMLASASCDGTVLLWKTGIEEAPVEIPEDVNGDGNVNINDLTFVADRLGRVGGRKAADVNGDGVVNVLDLVAIAKAMK